VVALRRPARATVTVDAAALAANARLLRRAAAPAELWAVVKADGYGHGAGVAARAALAAGASRLCVATLPEARLLQDAVPGARVLVMSPLIAGEEPDASGVEVTVSSLQGLERLERSGAEPLGVHVKVDTGMGRWGMTEEEALGAAERLGGGGRLRLAGLMSHLATADTDMESARAQGRRFAALEERFPPCPRHIANSAAALRLPELRHDAVRCGIALYGLSPFPGRLARDDGLRPALRLESETAEVKLRAAGESSGYGRRFLASEPTWVGNVPIGYADGVPRLLSGRADVLVGGRRRRVAATISMDQLTYVVGRERDVEPGERVVLLGEDGDEAVTAEEWAELTGTIPYEIATGLAPRPARVQRVVAGA
jgi:alanine racemase